MRIILLDNVSNLGDKYDIKEVADGYARNFLFPRRLAKLATEPAVKELEKWRAIEKEKQERELKKYQEIAKNLDGQEIEVFMKTGDDGTLYGAVTAHKITEVLNEKGFKIDREQLALEESIKGLGEYDVLVKFPHNLEVTIKVIVKAEGG